MIWKTCLEKHSGRLVASGTHEEAARARRSHTGHTIHQLLKDHAPNLSKPCDRLLMLAS